MSFPVADVVAFICRVYPYPNDLSNARLTKLVYLADWSSAQSDGHQVTSISWIFNNYGPWVPDVIEAANSDPRLQVVVERNVFGSGKRTIALAEGAVPRPDSLLDDRSRQLVRAVIATTRSMLFGEFIEYVYDTLPVRLTSRYEYLDLTGIAAKHRANSSGVPVQPSSTAALTTDTMPMIMSGTGNLEDLRAVTEQAVAIYLLRQTSDALHSWAEESAGRAIAERDLLIRDFTFPKFEVTAVSKGKFLVQSTVSVEIVNDVDWQQISDGSTGAVASVGAEPEDIKAFATLIVSLDAEDTRSGWEVALREHSLDQQ